MPKTGNTSKEATPLQISLQILERLCKRPSVHGTVIERELLRVIDMLKKEKEG
jgi:hypothetical protein